MVMLRFCTTADSLVFSDSRAMILGSEGLNVVVAASRMVILVVSSRMVGSLMIEFTKLVRNCMSGRFTPAGRHEGGSGWGESLVLVWGLFEGERPRHVEERVMMAVTRCATDGIGEGGSACVAEDAPKLEVLSSRLEDAMCLLLCLWHA